MSKLSVQERVHITARGFALLRRYCPGLAGGKALAALCACLQPLAAIAFTAGIVGEICGQKRPATLALYACAALCVNFAAAVLRGAVERVAGQREARMWSLFGKVFADKQLSSDYADLENAETQRRRKAAEENLFMFGNGLAQLVWGTAGLVGACADVALSLAVTASLFRFGAASLWTLVPLAAILFAGLCGKRATKQENDAFETWCEKTVWFNRAFAFYGKELPASIERAKDARVYRQSDAAKRAFDDLTVYDRADEKSIRAMAMPSALSTLAAHLGNAACYLFVALMAYFGLFGAGSVVLYVGALTRLGKGVQDLMFVWGDNAVYCGHLKSLFAYLDAPPKTDAGGSPVPGGEPEIEFCDVSFRYPGSETYALRHVSLALRPGKRLALVGANGSGKTTFVKLLCRLYEPTQGCIRLNGIDIQTLDAEAYRALISVVFQDFKLFSLPLGENVAANTAYDSAKAANCLEAAGFGDRLRTLPQGLATCLYKDFEESGVEISGGEAQKIALARALYRDAPILLLDEPTAALDPIAEAEVYEKFDGIAGGKTAVYISHRLSSCRFCDAVAVFDQGRIVQQGAHETLLADEAGVYRALWDAQAQYYKPAHEE